MKLSYRDTGRAFDAVASRYDAIYGPQANEMMTWMRGESLGLLETTFPPGSSLLEIGCGTGEEALALASSGRRVLATDVSSRMAALTQAKARAAGLEKRVTVVVTPAAGVGVLHPPTPLDGAYASFGALNCEPDLERLAVALGLLIRPGGTFVCSVMARCCPFEMAWFLLHGRPRAALRRLQRGWHAAPIAGAEDSEVLVATRYLTVGDLRRAFSAAFSVERTLSLPLLLPPPYLDSLFQGHRALFRLLERVERRLGQRWPWRLWGDHVAVVLRRQSSPA